MSIIKTTEKRRLIITLGVNEAPSHWDWEVVNFFRNEKGEDEAAPTSAVVPATPEEAAEHIGKASIEQIANINAMSDRMAKQAADAAAELADEKQKAATRAAEDKATIEALASQLAAATRTLAAVRQADAQWDQSVKPQLESLAVQ